MIDTQLADTSVAILSLLTTGLFTQYLYRRRKTPVRRLTLFLAVLPAMWTFLNMLTHLLAVMVVNADRMLKGTFVYSFHFYSLLLLGVVFGSLSGLQLNRIELMCQGKSHLRRQLFLLCGLLLVLSAPIIPLNPIGAVPVISSVIVLFTIAFTEEQWRPVHSQPAVMVVAG